MTDKDKIVKEINDEEWRKVLKLTLTSTSTGVRPSSYNFDGIYLSKEAMNEILNWNTAN